MRHFLVLLACFALLVSAQTVAPVEDAEARAIVEKAFATAQANDALARQYTFQEKEIEKTLAAQGRVEKTESETHDVTLLDGSVYKRLTHRNGQPIPAEERQKEEEKLQKSIEQQQQETPPDRQKRLAEARKRVEKERQMREEVLKAFAFRLAGEESLDGRRAWVIEAIPLPSYKAPNKRAEFLKKIQAKLWISKSDYGWMKVDAETIDKASMGWILVRLNKGAKLELTQRKVNDEVWLMESTKIRFDAKIGLIKNIRRESVREFSNFRKFQTDSRVIETAALE